MSILYIITGGITLILFAYLALAKPLGSFMTKVYQGERIVSMNSTQRFLDRVLGPVGRFFYRLSGVDPRAEMDWKVYAVAMLLFNALGLVVVYILQRAQGALPLNPQGLGAVTPDSSWNTAVSFASNTNWQSYGGETTMSYLTQMLALTVQNFVSAATGMAVLAAFIRGIARTPFSSPIPRNAGRGTEGVAIFGGLNTRHTLHLVTFITRAGIGSCFARRCTNFQRVQKGFADSAVG
jgi:K+-transporting ATPase ATPase A chain